MSITLPWSLTHHPIPGKWETAASTQQILETNPSNQQILGNKYGNPWRSGGAADHCSVLIGPLKGNQIMIGFLYLLDYSLLIRRPLKLLIFSIFCCCETP